VQHPFLESVQTIADLIGVAVSKLSLEEILPDAAQDFNAFYRQRSPEPATGSILLAAVDSKGIPMVKPGSTLPERRLTKGQKANKKRMATVAAVFTRAPWVRTPQRSSKAYSPPVGELRGTNQLPRAQRTNGCGPVCSKARLPSSRRSPKRCAP